MPWEWELRDNDDDNDRGLARFVILAEKSQAVTDFINTANLPGSSDDYQTSKGRYHLIQTIYNALCTAKIEYARSEDDPGVLKQKIRTPEEILRPKPEETLCPKPKPKGNCLDLTILFCALCWHYGLLPILIYVERTGRTHVLAAVSLKGNRCDWNESNQNHEFSQGLGKLSNADELREIIRQGGYIAIECTGFGKSDYWNQECQQSDKLLPFNLAEERGQENLASHSLKFAIDIPIANNGRYWWRGIIRDYLAQEKERASINNPITIGNLFNSDNTSDNPYVNPKLKLKDRNLAEDACEADEAEVIFNRIHSKSLERLKEIKNSTTDIGYRLAIIGEPGGGKTMLLLQIAEWIRERGELAIWISLPTVWNFLSGKGREYLEKKDGLRQYLFEIWLPEAVKETTQSLEECKETLKELLDSKKVWLLLDGANEIARSDALNRINDWLIDGLNWTRIVLTCRFNEWEMSKNSLTNSFNVYSLCGYEYQDEPHSQVHKFIHKWFKGEQSKIEGITQEIRNHVYLQSLSKNPLSLAMLCYIFEILGKGKMPKTKAELYRKFEDAYYQRKEDDVDPQFKVDITQRKTLRQTIGELAVKAFLEELTPIELSENLIQDFFENKPELINGENQFELVCKWGWLNRDDRGGSYKFFHPSFQEYFASQAIDDWDDFLPRKHKNQPVKNEDEDEDEDEEYKPYRVFEPLWKEIILFWLGRYGDKKFSNKKTKFINALVKFQDESTNFYGYRAHFLAAEGITQFRDCKQSSEIVKRVVDWSLNRFTEENQKQPGKTFCLPISQAAKDVLESFDREFIQTLIPAYQDENQRELEKSNSSNSLEKSNSSNSLSVQERVDRIVNIARGLHDNHPVLWQAIEVLGEIGNGNQTAIDFLIEVFDRSQNDGDTYLQLKSALHLAAIGISKFKAKLIELATSNNFIASLRELTPPGEGDIKQIFSILISISPDSHKSQLTRLGFLRNFEGILDLLEIIIADDPEFVTKFVTKFIDADPVLSKLSALYTQLTDRDDITDLTDVAEKLKTLGEYQSQTEYKSSFEDLRKLLPGDAAYSKMIILLREYLSSYRIEIPDNYETKLREWQELGIADYLYLGQPEAPSERFRDCYKTLWYCAQVLSYPEFYSAFNAEPSSNE